MNRKYLTSNLEKAIFSMVLMDKEKIIKTFLEKGYQLDSKSLDFFLNNYEKINIFFEKTKDATVPATIDLNFVKSLIEQKQDVEVLKKFEFDAAGKTFMVEDITKYFAGRYENLRKYFAGRLELVNLISINKMTAKTKTFSLIVMVKEKADKSLLAEDSTGETMVRAENEMLDQIVADEVIGIVCEREGDIVVAKKIIFPDIPLRRDIIRTEKDVCIFFISNMFLDQIDNSKKILDRISSISRDKLYVFVLGNVSSKKEDITTFFDSLPKDAYKIFLKGDTDPDMEVGDTSLSCQAALVKIENSAVVLICNGKIFSEYKKIWKDQTSENVMLSLLKKRHLNPTFDFSKKISDEDTHIIDTVPDIFVSSNFGNPGIINYKGTTIVANGSFVLEPIYWLINLKTRETIKMDFT
jgi:DNA polymerase II small subunit/DNA polymerase delta subunit B